MGVKELTEKREKERKRGCETDIDRPMDQLERNRQSQNVEKTDRERGKRARKKV